MKITGAVRVIKGQKVLPDDSTLDEHGIIDGATVNIVIEPDKEINLKIKLGPKELSHKILNSVRVRDLKQQLIDGDVVGFKPNVFTLNIFADDNDGIATDVLLEDESLPLHLYGVVDNTTVRIISGSFQIILDTSRGRRWLKTFPRSISISQMKQRIRRFLGDDKDLDDIWLFIQIKKSYQRLDDDEDSQIGSILVDNDVIFLVEDRFFEESDVFPVYYKRKEIGRIGWKITTARADGKISNLSDTALSLKLRIQELLGFPVSSIDVNFLAASMGNDEMIQQYVRDFSANIRIEVL